MARAGTRLLAPMIIAVAAGSLVGTGLTPEARASAGGTQADRSLRPAENLTVRVRAHVLSGRNAAAEGTAVGARRGQPVLIQARQRGRWRTVDRVRTGSRGRWRGHWRPRGAGSYRVRAVVTGRRDVTRVARRPVAVYRAGHASWYGPGLYGNRTACGQTLTAGTQGVAHKWLPCGTRVTFRHRGRSVSVRVIDRGPFAAGREWDLTAATKRSLGFGSTGTVWSTR